MLTNFDLQTCGIYKSLLIDYGDNELRIYTPGLSSVKIDINDIEMLNRYKNLLPKPIWNVPNLEAQKHEAPTHPCWVIFENGDMKRPIIMGWLGKGIKYSAAITSGGNSGNKTGDFDYSESGIFVGNGINDDTDTRDWKNGYIILDFLLNNGYTLCGACGMLGNLWVESFDNGERFNVNADNGLGYYGLVQWGDNRPGEGRLTTLKTKYPTNYNTLDAQLNYMYYELTTIYTDSDAVMRNTQYNSAEDAAYVAKYLCRWYEVAIASAQGVYNADIFFDGAWLQGGQDRMNAASMFYNRIITTNYLSKKDNKSSNLYFIGDSRVVGMFETYSINTGNYTVGHDATVSIGIKKLDAYKTGSTDLSNYDTIIIMLGVNDYSSNYVAALNQVADSYSTKNVVFVSILPVRDSLSLFVKNTNIITANKTISSGLTSCKYIDIYEDVSKKINKTTCPDGIHYNKELYQDIFNLIVNKL